MLITVSDLKSFWKIRPSGVVHVGAHEAEELEEYAKHNFGPVVWIEAQPELAEKLRSRIRPPSLVLQGLVWNHSGVLKSLNVTNNSQSSSVFKLGSHKESYPEIEVTSQLELVTSRLDRILPRGIAHNFLNLDIQGAEYEALEGLGTLLDSFEFVYSEVNRGPVYEGIKQIHELDALLHGAGFQRFTTVWTKANWGDALYARPLWIRTNLGGRWSLRLKQILFTILLRVRGSLVARKIAAFHRILGRIASPSKAR